MINSYGNKHKLAKLTAPENAGNIAYETTCKRTIQKGGSRMEDNKQFNKKPRIPLNPPKSQCSWMKTKWTNINAQKIQYLNPHYQFERRSRCPIDPDDEFSQCKLPNIKRYLKESKGVRAEELFDLRVLREDLSSARGMRLICVWPEKICTHYTLFFSTLFPSVPHFSPLSVSLSFSPSLPPVLSL